MATILITTTVPIPTSAAIERSNLECTLYVKAGEFSCYVLLRMDTNSRRKYGIFRGRYLVVRQILRGFKMRALAWRTSIFCLAALLVVDRGSLAAQTVVTRVDSARHEIIVDAGPFDVPAIDQEMAREMEMDHMAMHHDEEVRVFRFDWPVDGPGRGFRVEVLDSSGAPLARALLHHLIAINFDRRQFIYPAAERLFGIGKESPAVMLPGTLAVPLDSGQRLGFYVSWHNDSGHDLTGAKIRIVMNWIPRKLARSYTAVLPIYLDVKNEIGGNNTFDVPPGKSSATFDFDAPVDGQLLAVSGHLHDYGQSVRLEDAETGKVMVNLAATRDADGKIVSVAQKVFLFRPLKLRARHHYRVVAEYDSPLQKTIADGAMASIVGVFAPASATEWPPINPRDPTFRKDIESLRLFLPRNDPDGSKSSRGQFVTYGDRPPH
jgi:hypothetical protein